MPAQDDSRLLAYLSHELRTGLNAIVGHAQMLRLSELTPEDGRSVERMIDAGFYLVGILDEVEEIAGDELRGAARIEIEEIDLPALLDQLRELLGPLAGARGVQIEVAAIDDDAACVVACRRRLTQILLNLLSNAIKYGGGHVELSGTRRGDPGSGIGLALSRRLADLAGAKLSVRSELGEGATFTVAVKRADRQPQRRRVSR